MAVIMITHDLGVIAEVADRVMVMYAGEVVESGTLDQIFYDPQHPYTWGLLGSLTRIDRPRTARLAQIAGQPPSLIAPPQGCHFRNRCPHAFSKCTEQPQLRQRAGDPAHTDRCWLDPEKKKSLRVVETGEIGLGGAGRHERARPSAPSDGRRAAGRRRRRATDPILEVDHLVKHFPIKAGIIFDKQIGAVQAVDDVSFTVNRGETLGLVGESGCGKSTLSRTILQLIEPTSGSVRFEGREITGLGQQAVAGAAPRHADGLPGPVRVAQPAQARSPRSSATRCVLHGIVKRRRGQGRGPGPARDGRPQPRALQPLPARVLRRPAPADRDRAGARAAARS